MIELDGVSYAYPGTSAKAVRDVSLRLAPGEHVALVGPNGSGKSTIARLANGGLLARGGRVVVDGTDPSDGVAERREVARAVGFVRQDPDDQLVASRVFDEVAFGPCNLGLPAEEVRRRVTGALEACGLAGMEARSVDGLSGGQRQRLAVAGALATDPAYLVLDEATSYLDPAGRDELRRLAAVLVADGRGLLSVSHELEDVLAADRVVLVEDGSVTWEGDVVALLRDDGVLRRSGLDRDPLAPLLVRAARDAAFELDPHAFEFGPGTPSWANGAESVRTNKRMPLAEPDERSPKTRELMHTNESGPQNPSCRTRDREESTDPDMPDASLEFRDVTVRFGDATALAGVSLRARPGEVTLVCGPSGAGKSTALLVLAGVLEADVGSATLAGRPVRPGDVGLSFQRAQSQLFCPTVAEEVAFGPENLGLGREEVDERVERAMEAFGVARLADRSPLQLSGGQARRVALASAVAMGPVAYVLDEPTAGLDGAGSEELMGVVRALADGGAAVVVVSHDVCSWLSVADRALLLRAGRVAWSGDAGELGASTRPYEAAGMGVPLAVRLALADGRGPRDGGAA